MPESKKLSELIENFIYCHRINEKLFENRKTFPKEWQDNFSKIQDIKNQIDQKFEELRCECSRHNLTVGNLENSFAEAWLKIHEKKDKFEEKSGCCLFESFKTKGKNYDYLWCGDHGYRGNLKTNSCWPDSLFYDQPMN